jgi:hypothetical protein
VRGIDWSPAGDRLAAVTDDRILVFEPRRVGLVWQDRATHARPFEVRFDPTGRRLLVAHCGGAVTVWETGLDRLETPVTPEPRAWEGATLLEGAEAHGLLVRDPLPAAFDDAGRLGVLYSRLERSGGDEGAWERVFRVGVWEDGTFDAGAAAFRTPDGDAARGVAERGCALAARGGDFFVAYRRPRPDLVGGNAGELVWFDARRGQARVLGEPGNRYFDLHPCGGLAGSLLVTHYGVGTGRLHLTHARGGWSETASLGRFGDGYNHQTLAGPDGRLHVLYGPFPSERVGQPLTYLCHSPGEPGKDIREAVDGSYPAGMAALALGPDGDPAVLHARAARGQMELVLSRRTKAGWRRSLVLDRVPGSWACGDARIDSLACDARGRYHAVVVQTKHRRLAYLSGREGEAWTCQTISRRREADGEPHWEIHTRLLLDRRGEPVVVAGEATADGCRLRLFTRANAE